MDYKLDLDWNDFLQRYWQKRPVVLKRGFKNFVDPISPDELAGLAMESEVDSRLVSNQDGRWNVSHGPFESYDHLGENGWSVLVQAVDHWHEPSSHLMTPFRHIPDGKRARCGSGEPCPASAENREILLPDHRLQVEVFNGLSEDHA